MTIRSGWLWYTLVVGERKGSVMVGVVISQLSDGWFLTNGTEGFVVKEDGWDEPSTYHVASVEIARWGFRSYVQAKLWVHEDPSLKVPDSGHIDYIYYNPYSGINYSRRFPLKLRPGQKWNLKLLIQCLHASFFQNKALYEKKLGWPHDASRSA